jgi:polar amino acid transport system substrate-binding protein
MTDYSRRRVLAAGGLAAAGLAAPGIIRSARAEDDVLAKARAAGVLRIGTETEFAPFDFVKDGKAVGFNYDLLDEVSKEMKLKLTFIDLPWESVIPGLDAGKFDMVSGPATITKARSKRYSFTIPVGDATCALLKKAGDNSITKPADIAGKAVGSGKATSQLEQLKKYAATLPKPVSVREYVDFSGAYADLAAERIAAVANSISNIAVVAGQRPDTFALVTPPFGDKSYFGFFVRKEPQSASLIAAINEALLKIKKDGRMAKLEQKWFHTTFDTPDFVPEPTV